ncbi:Fc.00g100510.m01.CDS01 [Cosmosporella sp. VM-42]
MSPPYLKRGLALSTAVLALAVVAYRLQQPLDTSISEAKTYCYNSIRTHDDDKATARCFSVQDGTFTKVWTDAGVAAAESLEVENEDGYAIPGLWDGHGHLLQYGEFLGSVDLFGAESLEDVKQRMRRYLDANPGVGGKDHWVRGVGWDQTFFGRMPTAADIEQDDSLKGIYMMLDRIDVHCTWVSQSVLNLLPLEIPDIPGGEIIREPGMGVFCDNAMGIIMDVWPKPSPEMKAKDVKAAMRSLNEVGLVGMHDAGATPETLKLYEELAGGEEWTLRVNAMLECPQRNSYCPDEALKISRDDDRFTVRNGALGSWGSAMLEPYTDHPNTSGSLLINATSLTRVAKSWAGAGYQVNIHAIGDLANRNAVDALEAALRQECPNDDVGLAACQARHRFRIEHAQIIHPDDQKRIHDIGILPSIQPTHATSDMKYALSRLGTYRLNSEAYRMKSLLPALPILGSDFPVEPPNPFQGIYAAMTRKSPHTGLGANGSSEGWHVEETLSLNEAFWGFTGAPAYGAFLEGKAGAIREGAFADWVVLDAPVEGMDVDEFRTLKVRETWVAGKKVYTRA